jgi:DNA transposition AAA+ family ATPase
MSSTRYASDNDAPLQQQRWASNPDLSTSVSALIAAKRIALLENAELRNLLWFIQWRSLQPRGLRRLAEELLETFPERLGTPTSRRLRLRPGRKLSRSQTIQLRKDFPGGFTLRGELIDHDDDLLDIHAEPKYAHDAPTFYRSDDFLKEIARDSQDLHEHLLQLCVNPDLPLEPETAGVWYFDDLLGALRELESSAGNDCEVLADTEINRQLNAALDFCFRRRRMVLIEGKAGVGKTAAVKAWCHRSNGLARYVEVPSSNDDRSFFSAIAESLGVARGASQNGQQIKLKVEEALRISGLMLVFDESQFLWPQYIRPQGIPARIQWIKTIFDAGTPIALVALPKFSEWQGLYAKRTLWEAEQLERRVNRKVLLADAHSENDLLKIARAKHPTGGKTSWMLLVGYARSATSKQASAITEALESALDIAQQDGREVSTYEDIYAAVRLDFEPLPPAAHIPPRPKKKRGALSMQTHCRQPIKPLQMTAHRRFGSSLEILPTT